MLNNCSKYNDKTVKFNIMVIILNEHFKIIAIILNISLNIILRDSNVFYHLATRSYLSSLLAQGMKN